MTEITLTPSVELEARLSRIVAAAENSTNDLESAALLAVLIGLDHWEARPAQVELDENRTCSGDHDPHRGKPGDGIKIDQTEGREERGGVRPREMAKPGDPPNAGSAVWDPQDVTYQCLGCRNQTRRREVFHKLVCKQCRGEMVLIA